MALYFFNLRNGHGNLTDVSGTDLPNEEAARLHARHVALDLMQHRERRTQHWCLSVLDNEGQSCFEVPFASFDPSLAHLPTEVRVSIEQVCEKLAGLGDIMAEVKATILQVRATMARADRTPYLAAYDGRNVESD
jgi:hypothetical protein